MVAKIITSAAIGINSFKVEVEVDVASQAFPGISIVGLPDNAVSEAKKLRDDMIKNGYDESESYNIQLIQDGEIPASSLNLYAKMLQVTQEKYLKMAYTPIGTDHPNAIYYYLFPYFKDNNVSFNILDTIDSELDKRYYFIEKYINEINQLRKN